MNKQPEKRLISLPGEGPEDVVADNDGNLIVGVKDGRILRVNPRTGSAVELVRTSGRPLGLEVLPDGRILICDSPAGLLEFNPSDGRVNLLVDRYQEQRLGFCSNVVSATDGTIYFSTTTDRYTFDDWMKDVIEHIPTGRVFRRYVDGRVEMLLDGLYFANGLALARDQSWIIVAETTACRLTRLWLKGEKAGSREVFAELPGYPDNCSVTDDGKVWVAVCAPRDPEIERIHEMPLSEREAAARRDPELQPVPQYVAWAMTFDQNAKLVGDYRWDDGAYGMVTGVCQVGDTVYLSSTVGASIMAFDILS
ncbi:strictosidine synthase family protein [Burkholderia cenocepacia]|uniref:Strictosidine synthase family protein n=1 Tax=Burkholderia cenocepacia TaxID=95486 RepID=A0AAN0S0J8_9BURK|nr:strictosidine synthase family protein [Burkholderia cenocepacia]